MPFNVNTNMSSMQAQLNTSKTESSIGKSIQRLSSGLRVNGASDDAAGLAIAKNMAKQVSGYEVNVRNANDAVSLLQVAEGGMDEIGNMLQRMKDLALQSANGTNSAAQRNNMDLEFQQLISEIDRVVSTTEFNGLNLLDASSISNTNFQVDESNSTGVDTIQVSIADVRTSALSNATSTTFGTNLLADDVFSAGDTLTITYGASASTSTVTLAANATVTDMINGINADSGTHGMTAALVDNQLVVYNSDSTAGSIAGSGAVNFGGANTDLFSTPAVATNTGGSTLKSADILTETGANAAISVLDSAITTITNARAEIGASQNRFDKAINNLNNKIVNVSAAQGRIMDADFAKETAEFSKSQILQQAGVSMMAQAKALPNQLLSLLQ
jgi:flagellin